MVYITGTETPLAVSAAYMFHYLQMYLSSTLYMSSFNALAHGSTAHRDCFVSMSARDLADTRYYRLNVSPKIPM